MPVPVPTTRKSTSSPNRFQTISDTKKQQLAVLQATLSDPDSNPTGNMPNGQKIAMNGHTYTNGHTSPVSNGDATPNGMTHRRRRSKKLSGTPSPASSGRSSPILLAPPSPTRDGARTPIELAFEEWSGIMKRVVEEWEIPRKVLHSSIGFAVVYLYSRRPDTVKPIVLGLAGALSVIAPLDVLRLRSRRFERLYEKAVGFLMRPSERTSTNGVIWYLVGVIYVLSLLPRDIAVMSILILSWCDTAASTFGRLYGKYTSPLPRRFFGLPLAPRKSVAGSAAAIITGALVAIGFWGWAVPLWQGYGIEEAAQWGPVTWKWEDAPGVGIISGSWPSLVAIGVVTGLISGGAEALDLGGVDDNLSLPIISGTILWGLSKLAGFLSGFSLL